MTKSEEQRAWPRLSTNARIILEREGFCEDYQIVDFSAGADRLGGSATSANGDSAKASMAPSRKALGAASCVEP